MPIVAMPDGTRVSFPDDMPKEQIRGLIAKKFPKETSASGDGVPEIEQPRFPAGQEIREAFNENLEAAKRGLLPGGQGERGAVENLLNTGAGLVAIPGMALSPLTGAARYAFGRPLAAVEEYGRELSGMPADPQGAWERGKSGADIAAMAAMLGRAGPVRALPPPTEGQNVVSAANRLSDAFEQVNVPRAIASDRMAVQRLGQGIRNIPIVGDAIPRATARLTDDLGRTVGAVADEFGAGSGPNVASRIGRRLEADAADETRAATDAARASDDAVQAAHQRALDEANQAITQREGQSLERVRAAVGDMSPQDMGRALTQRLIAAEEQAVANKNELYGRLGRSDASIRLDAVQSARPTIIGNLEEAGVVIDPQLTPAANRMLDELGNLSNLNIPNRARVARPAAPGDELAGVTVQGLEQTRKRLSGLRSAASNDADRRAARLVMDQFDEWHANAFENSLLSGDPQVVELARAARQANADWRQRFGYNGREDADKIINKIVTGEVTPQEVSNWLIGTTQIGAKGSSSRLLHRIAEATGGDAEAMAAIRGGVWNRLSQGTEGTTAKTPEKIASGINEFLNGSGRDLAQRLFTPEQQGIMRAYADTIRQGQEARQTVAEIGRNTQPTPSNVGIGPMRDLAETVLGRGGKTDEAIFSAIDAYAKSGGRGDVQTLARIVRAIPERDRGDLAGAIIRNLGISPRTQQFSPDVFASQWASYTPQAKAILFGNAGPHRQALDDIMTISKRLKEVGNKFGNPSGTAQNVNLFAAVAAGFAEPLTTISAAVGGWGLARILSSPAGASSAAKLAKAQAAVATSRSPTALAGYKMAATNLANTAQTLGLKVTGADLVRALQGPVPVRADEEQR